MSGHVEVPLWRLPPEVYAGLSPGSVAQQLGVSRQAVHDAIRRGSLPAYYVHNRGRQVVAILITPAAVEAYKARPRTRAA